MSKINQILSRRFQARMPRLAARVTQRPVDAVGRGLGYLICEVGGVGGVRVFVNPDAVYYPGDAILVEQRGTPALASYTVVGWESGPRPDAGNLEITTDVAIGDNLFQAGDLVWGNPYAAHFHMDYSAGQINLKVGSTVTGRIDAGLGLFQAGNPEGLHGNFSASGIEFKNATTLLSGWDAVGRTIYGIETLGRPHGPGIQQREYIDEITGETRYAWQVLGLNGVPGISFITGTESEPEDYKFYAGPTGASNRLVYENGNLTLTGALVWANGAGRADVNGLSHVEDANNYFQIKPDSDTTSFVTTYTNNSKAAFSAYNKGGLAGNFSCPIGSASGKTTLQALNFSASGRAAYFRSSDAAAPTVYITNIGAGAAGVALYFDEGSIDMNAGNIDRTGDIITSSSANRFYIGASADAGSWRMSRNGSNLNFERYESGSWITKGFYTP